MEYSVNDYRKPDKSVIYKTASGVFLPMNIYYPDKSEDKAPVAFCVHGGSWYAVNNESSVSKDWQGSWMKHQAVYYAEKGFIGIEFSYRSIELEGVDIRDLENDCVDAVRFAVENIKKADTDNMFFIGDSAGGHLVLRMADLLDKKLLPKAVVACNPVLDLNEEMWYHTSESENIRIASSPIYNITRSDIKYLVMHGTADSTVDHNRSVEYSKKMTDAGNSCELVLLDGASHAFILYEYYKDENTTSKAMDIIDDFLNGCGF